MNYQIFNEDCLEGMKRIETSSVDMILTDLPYNLTDCAWDKSAIDLPALWTQFKRILKPYSSAVLFASGKFTHKLIASNFEQYKYKWIWVKNAPTMFVQTKNAPMRKFEEICIFSDGVINHASCTNRRMKYNPQGVVPCGEVHPQHGGLTLRHEAFSKLILSITPTATDQADLLIGVKMVPTNRHNCGRAVAAKSGAKIFRRVTAIAATDYTRTRRLVCVTASANSATASRVRVRHMLIGTYRSKRAILWTLSSLTLCRTASGHTLRKNPLTCWNI